MSSEGFRVTLDRDGLQTWYRQAMLRRMDELRGLRDAVEKGDPEACDALRDVAQALRGSGGSFGFAELSAVAGVVETTADAEALRRLEGLVDELRELADHPGGEMRFGWLARCAGLGDDELADTIGGTDDIEDAWLAVSRRAGLDDAGLAARVASRFGLRVADLGSRSRGAQRLVPEALMSSGGIMPLVEDSSTITVATADPTSLRTDLEVGRLTGRKPVFAVAAPAAVRAVLEDLFGRALERSPGEAPTAFAGRGDQGDPPRVLVVDDEPSARLLVRSLLERRGYEAVEASDGLEALDRIRLDDSIRLAVVDLNMPRMDGLELLWTLRDSLETAELPVIVVTGERDEVLETQIMEEGADDYVRKPVDPRLFVARVEATLRRAGRPTRPAIG